MYNVGTSASIEDHRNACQQGYHECMTGDVRTTWCCKYMGLSYCN